MPSPVQASSNPTHKSNLNDMPTIASPETHSMGTSLHDYLQMKVYPDIQQKGFKAIEVRGKHLRHSPARTSMIEKCGKPFNWQRPTTVIHPDGRVEVMCFPGPGYVQHYAAIVATYLELQGRDPLVVQVILSLTPKLHVSTPRFKSSEHGSCGYR